MLIILCLIVLSLAQNCPNCASGNCTTTVGLLSNCSQCISGFISIPMNVDLSYFQMEAPTTPITQVGVCEACPANCQRCAFGNSPTPNGTTFATILCQGCAPGYSLNGINSCMSCPDNCQFCDFSGDFQNRSLCIICQDGYVLAANAGCIQLIDSTGKCPLCQNGHCMSAGTLGSCGIDYCAEGSTGAGVMTMVNGSQQFGQIFDICVLCPSNCQECDYMPTNPSGPNFEYAVICTVCFPQYFLNSLGTCLPCPLNCAVCANSLVESEVWGTCTQCYEGFNLIQSNATCVYDNVTPLSAIQSSSFVGWPYQSMFQTSVYAPFAPAECPFCVAGNCSITGHNFGSCSACMQGTALIMVQGYNGNPNTSSSTFTGDVVGVCQPCPANCLDCSYETFYPAGAMPYNALGCTVCTSSFVLNATTGACMACPTNCANCVVSGTDIECTACNSGYTLSYSSWPFTCSSNTPSTANLQTEEKASQPTQSGSNTSTIIGLSIWGAVMTLVAGAFLFLWCKKSNEAKPIALLDGQTRTVSF